jgi:hypothetical protein
MHSVYIDCQATITKSLESWSVPLMCDLMEVAESNANVGGHHLLSIGCEGGAGDGSGSVACEC